MLPKKAVDQYKEIFFREFGIKLKNKEATQKANELIELFKVLLKPELDSKAKNLK